MHLRRIEYYQSRMKDNKIWDDNFSWDDDFRYIESVMTYYLLI